jgi:hypothetical protein
MSQQNLFLKISNPFIATQLHSPFTVLLSANTMLVVVTVIGSKKVVKTCTTRLTMSARGIPITTSAHASVAGGVTCAGVQGLHWSCGEKKYGARVRSLKPTRV